MYNVIFIGIGACTVYTAYRLGKFIGKWKGMDEIISSIDDVFPGYKREVYTRFAEQVIKDKLYPNGK